MVTELHNNVYVETKNGVQAHIDLCYDENKHVMASTGLLYSHGGNMKVREIKQVYLTDLEAKYKSIVNSYKEEWVVKALQDLLDNKVVQTIIDNIEYYLLTQQLVVNYSPQEDYLLKVSKSNNVINENYVQVSVGKIPSSDSFDSELSISNSYLSINFYYDNSKSKKDFFKMFKEDVVDSLIMTPTFKEEHAIDLLKVLHKFVSNSGVTFDYIGELYKLVEEAYDNPRYLHVNWDKDEETDKGIKVYNALFNRLVSGEASGVHLKLVNEDGSEENIF